MFAKNMQIMLIDNQFNKVLEPWGTEESINTISQNINYKSTHIVLNYLQIAILENKQNV